MATVSTPPPTVSAPLPTVSAPPPTVGTPPLNSPDTFLPTWTLADLQEHLGGIPPDRIRLIPPPGLATEDDLLRIQTEEDRLFELIDGVLVEKTMGYYESVLATVFIQLIRNYLDDNNLGIVLGSDGTLRILPAQVRAPDVSFLSWRHFPNRKLVRKAIPNLAPDLAIEVLSPSNTKREMDRKLREYFQAGTQLVWYVDPEPRTVTVYTSVTQSEILGEDQSLDGGDVLPGFQLSIRDLFARAGERE